MKESGTEQGYRLMRKNFNEKVNKEVAAHKEWCSPKCSAFLPDVYRQCRQDGFSAKEIQKNYDSCHIWR